ncbi:hypothetical protein KsCSTR_33410 [Candidatus Kuenenia stuttgartiensis]|uniref:Uncharacterized protein n=1 Tax=Kuenenia stuttgartiensis TaxID=174633 RepID=Q1Q4F9_KUEST|nr:hypothetical protein KsCSTR_33410 [Candidatus Kuenenia stuttgartiensis]CAJ74894.1 unknown protein [Candidatus Kuenenia stuttgartiensis]
MPRNNKYAFAFTMLSSKSPPTILPELKSSSPDIINWEATPNSHLSHHSRVHSLEGFCP